MHWHDMMRAHQLWGGRGLVYDDNKLEIVLYIASSFQLYYFSMSILTRSLLNLIKEINTMNEQLHLTTYITCI